MKNLFLTALLLTFSNFGLTSDDLLVQQLERTRNSLMRQINQIDFTLETYYAQQRNRVNIHHELLDFYYDYQYKKQFILKGNLTGTDSEVGQIVVLLKNGNEVASTIVKEQYGKLTYLFKQRLFPREDLRNNFSLRIYSLDGISYKDFEITCTAGENNLDQCGL